MGRDAEGRVTAARLATETGKKTVIEGPPVKLTLSQPLRPKDPSFREVTRDAYARRLARIGIPVLFWTAFYLLWRVLQSLFERRQEVFAIR